jgi:hypothetical protein
VKPSPLGDVKRVLLFHGGTSTRPADDPRVARAFDRAGIELAVAASKVQPPDSFELIVAVGDPSHAGQRAIAMGLPILPVESSDRLLALVDDLARLVVRRHWVPRLRLNSIRTRVVFFNARVTSTATAVPIDVHDGTTAHRLASLRFQVPDPFGQATTRTDSVDATCVGERSDGHQVVLRRPGSTVLDIRPHGSRERLHVVADDGRYSAVADHVEFGPARAIRVARTP